MMKYPIGIQSFEKIRTEGYVYVDKTTLMYNLVSQGSIYFLSRPRRFGKSLLLSTLENYFLGKKELFKGLAIDKLEKDWFEYPVFHIDFNGTNFTERDTLKQKVVGCVETWEQQWGRDPINLDLGERIKYVFKQAQEKTGHRVVVLVDEYDKPLLDVLESKKKVVEDGEEKTLEEINRNILKSFYSVFKLADQHIQFAFLTGVTKFSQVSVFSGFNQPDDISIDARYDALCGITKEELLTVFDEPIHKLAESYHVDYSQMVSMLQRRYDGYHFSKRLCGIFNPFSVLNCLAKGDISDYWFASGTPEYLMRLMANEHTNINDYIGKDYEISKFVDYKATKQMPLPMLYQSGYLTIKRYDSEFNTYTLDFPNEEVRAGMISLLSAEYFPSNGSDDSWTKTVTHSLRRGDLETFRLELTSLLAGISYRFQRKNDVLECERHFHYTFYLIMQMLGQFNVYVERETSRGRIDCVLECPDYIYIIEFKLNSTAAAALNQIEAKGYADHYASDPRILYKVGISFSSETGSINEFGYKKLQA